MFIAAPIGYFTISIVWRYFALSRDLWEVITGSLSILAIRYLIMNFCGALNMDYVETQAENF